MAKSLIVSTTLPIETKIKLEEIASAEERKLSEVVRKAVNEYIDRYEKSNKEN